MLQDLLRGKPISEQVELVEMYARQAETRASALDMATRLLPDCDGELAHRLRRVLETHRPPAATNANGRKLRQLQADLASVTSLQDFRYRDLLTELFSPVWPSTLAIVRLREQEAERLGTWSRQADTPRQRERCLKIVAALLEGPASAESRLKELFEDLHEQVAQDAAAGTIARMRAQLKQGAISEARSLAEQVAPYVPAALSEELNAASRGVSWLSQQWDLHAHESVTGWQQALDAASLIAEAETHLANTAVAHHPLAEQWRSLLSRLRQEALDCLHKRIASCRDFGELGGLLECISHQAPYLLARLQPDCAEVPQTRERDRIAAALAQASKADHVAALLHDLERHSRHQALAALAPWLKEFIRDLQSIASSWARVEAGMPTETAAPLLLSPPAALLRRLESVQEGHRAITRLSSLDTFPPSEQLIAEVQAALHDPALCTAAQAALACLDEKRRRHDIEMALQDLDAARLRALSALPADVAAQVPVLDELAACRDSPPFDDPIQAGHWWIRWQAARAIDLPSALIEVVGGIERQRLAQWSERLLETLADGDTALPDLEVIAAFRATAPAAIRPLLDQIHHRLLVRQAEAALREGDLDQLDARFAELEDSMGQSAPEVRRLQLQAKLARSRQQGSPPLRHLWGEHADELLALSPAEDSASLLADAMVSAWQDRDWQCAAQLANLPEHPAMLKGLAAPRLAFWRRFIPVAVPFFTQTVGTDAFLALSLVLFNEGHPSWVQEATAPLHDLIAHWQSGNDSLACAWAALVLPLHWPDVVAPVHSSPQLLLDDISSQACALMDQAQRIQCLDPDGITPLKDALYALSRRWESYADMHRHTPRPTAVPLHPTALVEAEEIVTQLHALLHQTAELEVEDFRAPSTLNLWQRTKVRANMLSRKGLGDLPKLVAKRLHQLDSLFDIGTLFEHYRQACIATTCDLDDHQCYARVLEHCHAMHALLNQCSMVTSPMATKLWSDCARFLVQSDPLVPLPDPNFPALRQTLESLEKEDRALYLMIQRMEGELMPSAFVENPIYVEPLAEAMPKQRPHSLRQEKRLRRFSRRELMPSLLSKHSYLFPDWILT